MIESLVEVKVERQSRFAEMIQRAKKATIGSDFEEASKILRSHSLPMGMINNAKKVVGNNNSVFAWVDALTRASGRIEFAGNRSALDSKIGKLLALAS